MIARLLRSLVLLSLAIPCSAQILQYADRGSDDMVMVTDGVLTLFDAGEEGRWLNQVEIFGTGFGLDPAGESSLYLATPDGDLLIEVALPNAILGNNEPMWRSVPIPSTQVPREFGVGLVLGLPPVQPNPRGGQMFYRFALMEGGYGGYQQQRGMHVGVYALEESHSFNWQPGSPGTGLGTQDWMIRAYMDGAAEGDPEAADIVMLTSGENFVDSVMAAEGDPLDVVTAAHGRLPREDIALMRLGAITVPQLKSAKATLATGAAIDGTLVSLDAETIVIRRPSGDMLSIPRADATRIEFRDLEPVPIASQPQPEPVDATANRSWGQEQVLGEPNTPFEGDNASAWAAKQQNGGLEWLRLTYETAVDIAEVRVRETFNPGAVSKVVAITEDETEVLLWEGEDPTEAAPTDFVVTVDQAVTARVIKVVLDTERKDGWNEIDAIELVGKDESRQWASQVTASSSYADR